MSEIKNTMPVYAGDPEYSTRAWVPPEPVWTVPITPGTWPVQAVNIVEDIPYQDRVNLGGGGPSLPGPFPPGKTSILFLVNGLGKRRITQPAVPSFEYIRCTSAGSLRFTSYGGTVHNIASLTPNVWHRIFFTALSVTGTTASGLTAGSTKAPVFKTCEIVPFEGPTFEWL